MIESRETATTALISRTQKVLPDSGTLQIYDAPSGTSCPFIGTVQKADLIVLVAEPTPFGLHDMDLVVRTLRQLQKPMAVIVNKSEPENTLIEDYCLEQHIEILVHIPLRDDSARTYAAGELIVNRIPTMGDLFVELLQRIITKMEMVSICKRSWYCAGKAEREKHPSRPRWVLRPADRRW